MFYFIFFFIKRKTWRDIPCPLTGKLNIGNMAIHPKLIYRFNAISNKISADFFEDINKLISKFTRKLKCPRIAKAILKKNIKLDCSHFPISNLATKLQQSRECGFGITVVI